ncbi:MAG: prepilin-type N-terminal cleavage/methylation domain-containing protein [Bacilli bacterium]|nr:prepilin-type N-terminal cleavage/methylation domain-containing protein [Bacilli bacterium]
MNKRGFTLVELITTFALAAVILVILINVLVLIKEIYTKSDTKTQLLINQANLSNAINSKLNNENIESYSECSDSEFCYEFVLSDETSIKLEVTATKIKFGNYVYKLIEGTEISTPVVVDDTNFLNIKISIQNKLYENEDFGINYVYLKNLENSN